MELERFIVTGGDNYNYVLFSDKENTAIAVDPIEPTRLLALIRTHGAKLTHILITHGHLDHTGGAQELAQETRAMIVGHKNISIVTSPVADGQSVSCATITVKAVEAPGHTFDSICYLIKDMFFTGDTLFFSGAGNCYSGDVESLYESFKKILTLPDHTKLYVGHEYARRNLEFALSIEEDNEVAKKTLKKAEKESMPLSTIGDEKEYNPFFRMGEDVFIEALEKKMNRIITDPKEAFFITRELRNRW